MCLQVERAVSVLDKMSVAAGIAPVEIWGNFWNSSLVSLLSVTYIYGTWAHGPYTLMHR